MKRIEGIDDNEYCKKEVELIRAGKPEEGPALRKKFLEEAKKLPDHCSCPEECVHHGNCYECVIIHRGHRDHLPYCFWDMVNERIACISHITEDSIKKE
jgi:hypothetical protein